MKISAKGRYAMTALTEMALDGADGCCHACAATGYF